MCNFCKRMYFQVQTMRLLVEKTAAERTHKSVRFSDQDDKVIEREPTQAKPEEADSSSNISVSDLDDAGTVVRARLSEQRRCDQLSLERNSSHTPTE